MRWVGEALRGAWTALAAHPGIFASVALGVAALNLLAPVAILSAVPKPLDYYTFNPWLKRLPEWLASDEAALGEKLAKLPNLALFGLYFALWRRTRGLAFGGTGVAASLFGISTGACSVSGCGAPVIPVLGL